MAVKLNSWSASALAVALLLAIGLSGIRPSQVYAGPPAPYGEFYVRLDQRWQEGHSNPVQQTSQAVIPVDSDPYEKQVRTLEQQGGPYADALSEPLTGLARYYLENGEVERAQGLYRRALHIVRVNEGLYSERQTPILRALLDSYRLTGDMEGLDDRYDYYFRLYGSGLPPYTPLRLRAASEYLRWQREALRLGLGDEKKRMLELYELNDLILEQLLLDNAVELPWRRQMTFSQLRNLYLLQDRFQPLVETTGYVPANQSFGTQPQVDNLNDRRLDNIVRSSKNYGADLLDELSGASGQASAAERAQVTLALADWYQWNNEPQRAALGYAQVVNALQQAGDSDLLQAWLGQPVELPDNGAFWQPSGLDPESRVVVAASYDVSAKGRASNIEISAATEAGVGKASSLRRMIAKTRFRPRFIAGQAEPVSRVEREYELTAR